MGEEEKKYSDLYQRLQREVRSFHRANQLRIRKGLRSLLIVPLIFLTMLFLTGGSKVIFLLLWIMSMFAIAAYLIGIEYMDYEMQKKLQDIMDLEEETPDSPLVTDREQRRRALRQRLQRLEKNSRKRADAAQPDDTAESRPEEAAETPATEEVRP